MHLAIIALLQFFIFLFLAKKGEPSPPLSD